MADALDRLAAPAAELLARVDAVLVAHGLPVDHPIAGLLRRLGALPADALHAICAQRSGPLRAAASELRRQAQGYEYQRVAPDWDGAAGELFAAQQEALLGFLADSGARLRATADHLDEVAEWVDSSRREMAEALADVLGSVEAVGLHTTGDPRAAATIGARVLAAADSAHTAGRDLAQRWVGRLDEVPYRPAGDVVPAFGATRLSL